MRTLLVLVALAVAGCDDHSAPPPHNPSAEAAPPFEVPSIERGGEPAPPGSPLIVTPTAIRLGEGPDILALTDGRVRAEDKTGGAEGLLVPALRDRMQTAAAGEWTSIAVHPAVPFQSVLEVAYTLGQSGHGNLAFLVRSDRGLAALPITLPNLGPGSPQLLGALDDSDALADVLAGGAVTGTLADVEETGVAEAPAGDAPRRSPTSAPSGEPTRSGDATLNLSVTVAAAGITVSGSGGRLAPGCETLTSSRAPTVPTAGGRQDLAALTRCLEIVKRQFPDEDLAFVTADPDVRFADVAAAIAASRATAQGQPLFPRTALATSGR